MTIDVAKTGRPSAEHGGIRIHSPYDPEKEAARFLDSALPGSEEPRTLVLIGAALGYTVQKAAQRWPNAEIIAIHLNRELYNSRIPPLPEERRGRIRRWYPGSERGLAAFLSAILDEKDMRGLRILEWPPAAAAMPDEAEEASRCIAEVVRRCTGSISATAAFGRSWIRNALRNYVDLEDLAMPAAEERPVVIAASGPSLEFALPRLLENRGLFRLWALSSAMPALADAGLVPDLIFATDSGHWARLHMRSFPPRIPVAMPLSAAPLPAETGLPLLIRQGIPGESRLLEHPAWPILPLPPRGTVAATAVEAWSAIASGPLLLIGLDLCWRDLKAHARPHAFEGWIASRTNRCNPPVNESWNRAAAGAPRRSGIRRTGPSLETYADWFRGFDGRGLVFRFRSPDDPLDPSPVENFPFRGPDLFREWESSADSPGKPAYRIIKPPLNRRKRRESVIRLLNEWKNRLEGGWQAEEKDAEYEDLLFTLDPGGALDLANAPTADKDDIAEQHIARVKTAVERLGAIYA